MKSIKGNSQIFSSINSYVSDDLKDRLGIVILSISDTLIEIGAMNPEYNKVNEFIKDIEQKFSTKVFLKQISADEWERKRRNKKSFNIDTEFKGTNADKVQLPDFNKSIEEKNSVVSSLDKTVNENLDKFDFFDADVEEALEESDFFDDTEFQQNEDPVISAVRAILTTSVKLSASDIHAEPLEDRMRIRYRVDGVLQDIYSLPKARSRSISSRIKVMSKLDIAERRLPQDGRLRYRFNENILDFRVSTLPGKWGEKIVLRILKSDPSLLDLNKLISFEKELKLVRSMGNYPYGIFIVVGPTGSGKSTTLYSILNERNTPDVNITTVEDPVEYTLDGIHQVQVIREKGLDFSRALRSLMRQDPDIILVGETRDKETAQTAMEAALTGHMVFTTLHANDTSTAITRLAEMGIPPYLISSTVVGVMAQRLVRKVCKNCCSFIDVDPLKDKLAFDNGIKKICKATIRSIKNNEVNSSFFKDENLCQVCNGSGYKGRLGLYEVMRVNENIRSLIMKSANAINIKECAINHGMRPLLNYGLELVNEGLTTLEEVERVCLLEDSEND